MAMLLCLLQIERQQSIGELCRNPSSCLADRMVLQQLAI